MVDNNENNGGVIEQANGNLSMLVWLVIFLVLLGLVGGYFFFRQKASSVPTQSGEAATSERATTTQSPTIVEVVTVTYKDGVFTPSIVTIKKDTVVKFINQGSDQMWIASSPHPQHTDLPGFDQLKGVGKGESYEYTFTKVGTWKYHNHLKPTAFGSVVVE